MRLPRLAAPFPSALRSCPRTRPRSWMLTSPGMWKPLSRAIVNPLNRPHGTDSRPRLRLMPSRPLHPLGRGATVVPAPAVSHLVVRISFLTHDLCAIAAVCVQLKAVVENGPLYMVFYYLTRPPFAVKVGETLRWQLEFGADFRADISAQDRREPHQLTAGVNRQS